MVYEVDTHFYDPDPVEPLCVHCGEPDCNNPKCGEDETDGVPKPKFVNPLCPRCNKRSQNLKKHLIRCPGLQFECRWCLKRYWTEEVLTDHQRSCMSNLLKRLSLVQSSQQKKP